MRKHASSYEQLYELLYADTIAHVPQQVVGPVKAADVARASIERASPECTPRSLFPLNYIV